MSFISYAQNFEDVMLWRALKDINKGFYIDIGAWSPDQDSVTRAFYERGWHGINIEPNPEFIRQLQNRRPHDINLQLAIGDQEETLSMNFLANPGLSTLDDAIAQKHQEAGWEVNREPVQVTTLNNVWADYVPTGQEVHFLKVDVEGFEAAVLRGNDWRKNRPWIIVVESTLPMSQEQSYGDWEPMLLNAGYYYAYFDGLNRFYVAKEHSGLLDSFKAPPNFFDDFVLYRQQEAEGRPKNAPRRPKPKRWRPKNAPRRPKPKRWRPKNAPRRPRPKRWRPKNAPPRPRPKRWRPKNAPPRPKPLCGPCTKAARGGSLAPYESWPA
ncbi:MAG: FkbM family methyltransferase [Deltaproteobacteria bacterium]|nr:FkbM family methyltransferase [Deltaproteobacteria bacterium]